MNEERLLKIIEDMSESIANLGTCKSLILAHPTDETTKFIAFGLKQIFVDFFITVEDFTSIMLKELSQFKVGMDMRQGLEILKEKAILDETLFSFLNRARLLRNRISHRYKEPSQEELMGFIEEYHKQFISLLQVIKQYQ
jgi:uncharacterized protein YutE (UPF0331/DUF86 family)